MSYKILLDPIYTGPPETCSCAFKHKTLVETVLKERDDVYFYWLVPDYRERSGWYPEHRNVRYVSLRGFKDRMREYLRFPDELYSLVAFNGELWDFDMVFTARTSQVPTLRAAMGSPRAPKQNRWMKKIVIDEEMIIAGFRSTVAKSDVQAQELLTLAGYLSADRVYLTTDKERTEVLDMARSYLSPSKVMALRDKISMVAPVLFRRCNTKAVGHMYDGKRRFGLGFVGRLEKVSANIKSLHKVLFTQAALRDEKALYPFICTVTEQSAVKIDSAIEIRRPQREEFWNICREEMDVQLCLNNDSEFSLSNVEPVMLGVPLVVIDQPWARSIFGDQYPFYAKNETHAYVLVGEFMQNYAEQYAKFAEWQQKVFAPMFRDNGQFAGDMYASTVQLAAEHEKALLGGLDGWLSNKMKNNDIFREMQEHIGIRREFRLFDVVQEMSKAGTLDMLARKIKDGDRDSRRIVFSTAWNDFRLYFKLCGWVDASTEVGHLKLTT